MSSITDEVLQKYGNLVPQQKKLVRSLNDDKSDEDLARMLGLQPAHIGELVTRVSEILGLPKMANHYGQKQLLAEVERRYALKQQQQQESAHEEVPHLSPTEVTSAEGEADAQPQLPAPQLQVLTPSVDDLVPKIDRLKQIHLDTLNGLEKLGRRDTSGLARSLGIGVQSVYNRFDAISEILGISHLRLDEAKILLCQVMGRRRAIQEAKIAEGLARQAERNPAPAQLPAPVEEAEVAVLPERTPVPDEPASTEPALHPPQTGGGTASPGVVIQLPSDVVDIDVVAGTFNGGAPSRDMAAEVRQRKERGLKPTFLVLSPMQGDPTTTLAQVVFLERDT